MTGAGSALGVQQSRSQPGSKLAEYGAQGVYALISVVPGLVGSGFVGAIRGFFSLGLAAAIMTALLQLSCSWVGLELPSWLWVVHWIVWPLSFGIAGGYVGGARALLARLSREVAERNLVVYLYAIVRPTLSHVACSMERGAGRLTPTTLRQELQTSARSTLERLVERTPAAGWIERVQTWVGLRMQLMLTLAALPVMTSTERQEVVAELEAVSVERVEEALADSIRGLFDTQVMLAGGVAALVSGVPLLGYALLG